MNDEARHLVDLFSGLGGLSLGLEKPDQLNGMGNLEYEDLKSPGKGFQTVLAVDENEDAAATVEHHFPDIEVIANDINQIESFTQWDDAEVIVGGPPCQGFSNLNSTKTEDLEDERNNLWKEYMRAVEDIQPDVFLIENVPRFLNSQEGAEVVSRAEDLGYTTVVDRLWAHEYGVPQKRHRAFIIGSKVGTPVFPAPTEGPVRTVKDAIGDLPRKPNNENWHETRNFSEKTIKRIKEVPEGGNRFDIPEKLLPECWKDYEGSGTDLFGRLWIDEPAVTIRTGFFKPMKGRHLHPAENRAITLREGARLQTIPDSYTIKGRQAQWRVGQQIGNAVPPKLAYHLGWAIEVHLQGLEGEVREQADDGKDPFAWPELVEQNKLQQHVKKSAEASL